MDLEIIGNMTKYKVEITAEYEDLIISEGWELTEEIQRVLKEDFEDVPGINNVKVKVIPL